jgi:hypothetical protein
MVKLKCNRGHIQGFNIVLANKVKMSKIQYMIIYFYCNLCSYKKSEISHNYFSIECGVELAYQAAPKLEDNRWHLFPIQHIQNQ